MLLRNNDPRVVHYRAYSIKVTPIVLLCSAHSVHSVHSETQSQSLNTVVHTQLTHPYLCCAADPFLNDQNFVLSVLSLEELGATGNKGLAGLTGNPVLANGIAALATSATAQATVQRMLLWQMRNYTVEPFGETVQQVFARVSALRDSLDGPQVGNGSQ